MDPQDQLALDEALLLAADEATDPERTEPVTSSSDGAGLSARSPGEQISADGEILRVWQFDRPVVVLGRSSKIADEVDRGFCAKANIPVLRRCSGGATVVGGPGCLMYSVVLRLDRDGGLQKIDVAHQYVMTRLLAAVGQQLPGVRFQGTCDLTWRNQKFSGNSLRIARRHLLYHGTILFAADLDLIARCLADAPRQPEYRNGRPHRNFIANVAIEPQRLCSDLSAQFGLPLSPWGNSDVDTDAAPIPDHLACRMQTLRRQRYANPAWHLRH